MQTSDDKIKILVIDDEQDLANQICENLELDGFTAKPHYISTTATDMVDDFRPDVVILDKMMPDKDGIDVLKDIRSFSKCENVPIIMLTACNTKFDKLWAFNTGADDYIAKPFDFEELAVRVRAVTRRLEIKLKRSIQKDGLDLTIQDQYIKVGNSSIELTSFEFDFLKELINKKGKTLSKAEIFDSILENHSAEAELDQNVIILKKKLKELGNRIKEIRGVGYRFV